jgi:hypothetical protein
MWISKRRRLGDAFSDGRGRVEVVKQALSQTAAASIVREHAQTTCDELEHVQMGTYLWVVVE